MTAQFRSLAKWIVCPICKEEFRTEKAEICEDCKHKAYKKGMKIKEYMKYKNVS